MKRTVLILLTVMALCGVAQSQVYYYRNNTPWNGDKAYSLNAGYVPGLSVSFPSATTDSSTHLPWGATFLYSGEKTATEHFSWGYQVEALYHRMGWSYTRDGDAMGGTDYLGKMLYVDRSLWNTQLDLRILLAWYFSDQLEVMLAGGVYSCLLFGSKENSYTIDKTTQVRTDLEPKNTSSFFSFDMGISGLVGANYYLTDNFFASFTVRYFHHLSVFGEDNKESLFGNRIAAMVGIGYKIIK